MPVRAFLDANVFIYAFERPESNSARIIGMLNGGEMEAVVSELAVIEVMRYFKKYHGKDLASKFRDYILQSCELVLRDEIPAAVETLHGSIKDKDLEHLATVRTLGLKYLVSYDDDFIGHEEYVTPRDFLIRMGRPHGRMPY